MKVLEDEPLSRHGYWRVGGPIERLAFPESADDLASILAEKPRVHVLGNGSNLLVPDAGLRGTVVKLGGELRESRILSEAGGIVRLHVGAGLLNAVLLARAAKLGLSGLGLLAGVPGTVGGAVAMNAGTALGEVADILESIEGFGGARAGLTTIPRADLPMRYREGGLPDHFVVTAAVFRLAREGVAEEQARMASHLARRKATQPLDLPSCGSVFRNPPCDHAGRLIETVGLKGHREGGAEISQRHANFIVNVGGATAADVMACIRMAWTRVRTETGVSLVPEVRVLGQWPAGVWPLS